MNRAVRILSVWVVQQVVWPCVVFDWVIRPRFLTLGDGKVSTLGGVTISTLFTLGDGTVSTLKGVIDVFVCLVCELVFPTLLAPMTPLERSLPILRML